MNRAHSMRLAALLLAWAMLMMLVSASRAWAAFPSFDVAEEAGAAILIEVDSGKVLAEKNADEKLPMASTTKIMTALVVSEKCSLDEVFVIPDEAVGIEGSSICLSKGERMSVRDLLYGLMLASGNDAAVALAVHTAGSTEAFAEMMNDRAKSLGLCRTHFVTPNGLHDPAHYTTARELAYITAEAMRVPELVKIVSSRYYRTVTGDHVRTFKNKNALLWDYEGAFGVKTGYTSAAGRCLVFGAEREGMTLIGVLLNCRPMFEEAAKLMERAFDTYKTVTVLDPERDVFKAIVKNSAETHLEVAPKKCIIALIPKETEGEFRLRIEICEPVKLPIEVFDAVGRVEVFNGDSFIGSAELVALNSVHESGFGYWFRIAAGFLSGKSSFGALF